MKDKRIKAFSVAYDVLVVLVCVMCIYANVRLIQVKREYNELYNNCKTVIETYCTKNKGILICKYPEEFTVTQQTDENGNVEISVNEN